jgi:hypothetical protein
MEMSFPSPKMLMQGLIMSRDIVNLAGISGDIPNFFQTIENKNRINPPRIPGLKTQRKAPLKRLQRILRIQKSPLKDFHGYDVKAKHHIL